jgi:dienelactone hydrolase
MNWRCELLFCVLLFDFKMVSADHKTKSFEHEASGKKSTALPKLDNSDYEEMGTVTELEDGLSVYSVGNSSKCIIWNYDIFGFSAGRTRQLCDYFADQGYFVVLPDDYRGTFQIPWLPGGQEFVKRESNWTALQSDWLLVKEFAESNGAVTFGAIGTCWGTYPTVRLSSLPEFKAAVSMHPSHSPVMKLLEEDEKEIYQQMKSPQLFMPSGSDDANVKLGGLAEEVLGDNLTIVEFNDMQHGWTTRGNLTDPTIDRDVHKAIKLAVEFFNKHL